MTDIDVTANQVENIARTLKGGAGPSGTGAEQWKNVLLRYRHHSLRLREAIASLTRLLSNNFIAWERKCFDCQMGRYFEQMSGE